jgi:hypothetical protein
MKLYFGRKFWPQVCFQSIMGQILSKNVLTNIGFLGKA